MFFNRANKLEAKEQLRNALIVEYAGFANKCDIGSIQCQLFERAVQRLKANEEPKAVRNWVILLETEWNKEIKTFK